LPEFLQLYADSDQILAAWDFLFVGYQTRSMSSYLDIAHIISTQWQLAAADGDRPFDQAYEEFALF
jgi:hypothetical protein